MGTRGSLLARMQSDAVAQALTAAHPGLRVETLIVSTTGDALPQGPLRELGGKGLFVKELQQAILDGAIDFAVHSFKDVPVTMPLVDGAELTVAATPLREDPRDVLETPAARRFARLDDLPTGAVIGTGSLRRQAQIRARRRDVVCASMRGNVDTRLKKLAAGECDALVLALAGLRRCGLQDAAATNILEVDELVPAAGQGALALECRRRDRRTRRLLEALNDPPTALCVQAERAMVHKLLGDCQSPIGVLAVVGEDGRMHLRCAVGARDAQGPVIFAQATARRWRDAVEEALKALVKQDVYKLLHGDPGDWQNAARAQPYH